MITTRSSSQRHGRNCQNHLKIFVFFKRDEAFKKLRNNLTQLFGQGGGSSNGGGSRSLGGLNKTILSLLLIAVIVVYIVLGVYTVDQQERGVVLRFGKKIDSVVLPGLHWNPPLIDKVLIENVTTGNKTNQVENPHRSGFYLILHLRHHFDPKHSYTSLTLARDTYGLYTSNK